MEERSLNDIYRLLDTLAASLKESRDEAKERFDGLEKNQRLILEIVSKIVEELGSIKAIIGEHERRIERLEAAV